MKIIVFHFVNRKRRSFVCSAPYYRCSKIKRETFCSIYPRFCPFKDPNETFPEIPFLPDLEDDEYDWDETYLESHNESMIDMCEMKLDQKKWSCNKNYMRIPVLDSKNQPNCCFTIESLVGQPEAEDKLYPNNLVIDLHLQTQGEEYSNPAIPAMIQIQIHDRRAIVNPFADGFHLEGGSQYTAYVSMETQELLPPPYDTNCIDYLEMWRENNGTGPLNHLVRIY
ncbi:uncharacterized protein TNCT_317651 [Trichonephila clavata]|uniref:Uncharacterized protein n=1 Tax=Trichonephila clavata TaxID=2740835 RepID=A0A8X6LW12_TRICU|nr:uncharacterized protein TNCT_317651 [Trichonephila clavata]